MREIETGVFMDFFFPMLNITIKEAAGKKQLYKKK